MVNLSKFFNHRVDEKTRAAIDGMTTLEKDQMYRGLWFEFVCEDLYQLCEDKHITDDDISRIAKKYVYDCDYDCEIPYYDQLYALLDEVTLEKQSEKKSED